MSSLQQAPMDGQQVPPPALIDGVSQQQIDEAVKAHVKEKREQRYALNFTADAKGGSSFRFDQTDIRVVTIKDEPWFVAADVCKALEIINSRDALLRLDDDEKGVGLTDTLGGPQKLGVVSESGLYTLVLRCRDAVKPGTVPHRFRKWVSQEVLPSIRKTGGYGERELPPIDVRKLMLSGAKTPEVQLPSYLEKAIDKKAWLLAKEAYDISREHLRRRIAYVGECGYPVRRINRKRAMAVIRRTDLGYALTHLWHEQVRPLDDAIRTKVGYVMEMADILDILDKVRPNSERSEVVA